MWAVWWPRVFHSCNAVTDLCVTLATTRLSRLPSAGTMKSHKATRPQPTAAKAKRAWMPWILNAATLLGLFLAVVAFYPRPIVSAADPVDPNNPFSASFTITNSTMIPLHHVNIYFALKELAAGKPFTPVERPNFEAGAARLLKPEWKDHSPGMDERYTITPGDLVACCKPGWPPIIGAEVGIIVEYNTWILPWKRVKAFAFVTHKQTNGQLYWYSIPDS
jgi:hypothetical protein